MTTIYLIRHGQSIANRDGILQGQSDMELSDIGIKQAQDISKRIQDNIGLIISSPLRRAYDTAKHAFPSSKIITDDRLMEMNLGNLEGVEKVSMTEEQHTIWKRLTKDMDYREHGGETPGEMISRVQSFFEELTSRALEMKDQSIVLVTHYGVIRSITSQFLGEGELKIENGGIIELSYTDGGWVVNLFETQA